MLAHREAGSDAFGMIAMGYLFNAIGSATNPMFRHALVRYMVLGGFAFGMLFMAADPGNRPLESQHR
jgi:Na+-transporting NADH:ubiquinone oxidoreductase subunit NqrB